MWFLNRVANPVLRWVLRSRMHRLASGSLMLITLHGRRTGRAYTIPVQYAEDGGQVIVYPGRPGRKVWWKNLEGGVPVTFRIRGRETAGTAHVVREPSAVADGLAVFLARFPSAARSLGVPKSADGAWNASELLHAAMERVIVRIEPSDG
ncbi:MAG TPA: nitroreductase/quinone reductase family protein [Actinomycetota bacterium]